MISLLFVAGVLAVMSFRDFVSRAIELYYFLLMAIAVLVFCMVRTDTGTMLQNILVNTLQLALLIGCLAGYYRVKSSTAARNFFSTKLGLGDLLFWIVATPLFTPLNFMLWMVFSLLFSLVTYGSFLLISGKKGSTIPLAGIQSVTLIIVLVLDQFVSFYDLLEKPCFLPTLN